MVLTRKQTVIAALVISYVIVGCAVQGPGNADLHRWWSGLGPVLPHDSFPSDCELCHVGDGWNTLVDDFTFDHARETGVALHGAHKRAQCLRCHNDRGPVVQFQRKGCGGCHEDVHQGDLGVDCASCHEETTWRPVGQIRKHDRTRFPLVGAHAATACHRCHPGARVGNFRPTDNECVSCHRAELANTTNPPHIPLGWVDRCDRCHMPIRWNQAFSNN